MDKYSIFVVLLLCVMLVVTLIMILVPHLRQRCGNKVLTGFKVLSTLVVTPYLLGLGKAQAIPILFLTLILNIWLSFGSQNNQVNKLEEKIDELKKLVEEK